MKHGSSITRLFVISCSMLVNAALSWLLLGLQLTPAFLLAVLMIALAAHLYYGTAWGVLGVPHCGWDIGTAARSWGSPRTERASFSWARAAGERRGRVSVALDR
ncbi:hypothetical protein ANANG_G00072730 [Anguilla anguilla]|uniref:Uncharacterized protein n=1 Tax=Anguilla anguilla TaxID=7936 RepID=A0A9D3MRD0_ANGAN|nr:hypothetical protein ANANG_G00072730 [Anguilla anguilla]